MPLGRPRHRGNTNVLLCLLNVLLFLVLPLSVPYICMYVCMYVHTFVSVCLMVLLLLNATLDGKHTNFFVLFQACWRCNRPLFIASNNCIFNEWSKHLKDKLVKNLMQILTYYSVKALRSYKCNCSCAFCYKDDRYLNYLSIVSCF
jgi:hypothetical protein